jgi:hypothetical protein
MVLHIWGKDKHESTFKIPKYNVLYLASEFIGLPIDEPSGLNSL